MVENLQDPPPGGLPRYPLLCLLILLVLIFLLLFRFPYPLFCCGVTALVSLNLSFVTGNVSFPPFSASSLFFCLFRFPLSFESVLFCLQASFYFLSF